MNFTIDPRAFRKISLAVVCMVAVAVFLLLSYRVEASTKFWIASGPGNFNDNANWSLSSGGPANTTAPDASDVARFDGNGLGNCTITANVTLGGMNIGGGYSGAITVASGVDLTFGPFSFFQMDGGTFNASNGTMFINAGEGSGSFTQNGGVFNGNGTMDLNVANATFGGGIFNATPGITTFHRNFIRTNGTFNHNNGTVIITAQPGGGMSFSGPSTQTFNNLTLSNTGDNFAISGTAVVLGTLSLNSGVVLSGTLDAQGAIAIDANFAGGNGLLSISGAAPRPVTFAVGASLLNVTLNAPNVSIGTSGSGTLNWRSLTLQSGTINQGSVNFALSGSYSQSGGTFNASNGSFSVNPGVLGTFIQSGGVFNGNGTIDLNVGNATFSGGTFNASPGNTTFHRGFTRTSGIFNPNNGVVIFATDPGTGISLSSPATQTFKNLTLSNTGDNFSITGTVVVEGTLRLVSGLVNSGTIEARGDVVVESTFGFGNPATGGTTNIAFNGAGNQTFTNNGGANPTSTWTVNKTNGTLTAASSITLGTSQALNITSGTLYLNNNSNLTCGALTIGTNGRLLNDSSTTITLGANATNNGRLDLQGSGAACPQSDTILLRSSVTGTRRNWSGTGVFALADVDVQDMGGSSATQPAITVFSGTNSGNNNTNWTFISICPLAISISPQIANAVINTTVQFTAGGGSPPFVFSLVTNNSGASINSATGLYTAGSTAGVTDTVRVTDSFGTAVDATVTVSGAAHHLAFVTQPANTSAGQTINAVQLAVQDQANNTVASSTSLITMTIATNPGCPSNCGTLFGTVSVNAINGIATFSNLSIQRAGTGYTFQAATSGLPAVVSTAFNIVPGAATRVGFVTQPTNIAALAVMTPSIQVAIQDAFGNTVTSATGSISISLNSNPGNDQFFGTRSATSVSGIATFNNLFSNVPADGYALLAHRSGLTDAVSNTYNITRPLLLVTNTSNSGAGSLKQAIDDANLIVGPDNINFNISGTAPFTIQPVIPLPEITGPVVVDATTQAGYAGSPIVELRGQSASSSIGLLLSGGNSTIRGLAINNWQNGIQLTSNGGNTVQGNYIGVDFTGSTASANSTGILVNSSQSNQIGGTTTAARNVISGNLTAGITLSNASQTIIKGNFLGTNSAGTIEIPNQEGIRIQGSTSNCSIGGLSSAEANVIIYSTRGIHFHFVGTAVGNSIRRNLIKLKTPLSTGIDLDPDNRTPNDPGDADTGGNNRQNFPVINSATVNNGVTTVQGTLNSSPSTQFSIELYSYLNAGSLGSTATFQGTISLSTNSSGIANFQTDLPLLTANDFIVATATDLQGNTSEISEAKFVVPQVISISGQVVNNSAVPLRSVKIDLTGGLTASTTTDTNGNYSFNNLPGGLTYTVTPTLLNYNFSPASRTSANTVANQVFNFTGTKVRANIIGYLNQVSAGQTFPVFGATVTLSGPTARTTGANAVFVFTDLPPGQYTITPEKSGVVFSPSTLIVNLTTIDQTMTIIGQTGTPLPGRLVFGVGISGQMKSMNADGSAYATLLDQSVPPPNNSNPFLNTAALSRDGKLLVGPDSVHFLSVSNADGSSHRRLPVALSWNNQYDYAFSPDGTKIACVAGDGSMKIVNTGGSGVTTLSIPSGLMFKASPTWLSNSRIAFSATEAGINRLQIFAINIDSTGLAQLTSGSPDKFFPVASPNGAKVAFATQGVLHTMNANGSGDTVINSSLADQFRFAWSPDGTKLCFSKVRSTSPTTTYDFVAVSASNGGGLRVILNREVFGPSWGPPYEFTTATGSNVNVNTGFTSISFGGVTSAGTTTVTPIPDNSISGLPGTFQLAGAGMAFEISTTASFTPPITVCFIVPSTVAPTQSSFNLLSLMHSENGVMVDTTTSRTFSTLTICGSVNSLSPFALAEQVNPTLPSIRGIVQDTNGSLLADVPVNLTGTETRTTLTDAFGNFAFVNLTQGGNYNVQPKQPGYLFAEYSQDIVNLTSESTVVFTGTPSNVEISGRVTNTNGDPLSNITIGAEGPTSLTTTTNANGEYTLTDLLVDGSYTVVPSMDFSTFAPASTQIDPLISNVTGVDFVLTVSQPAFSTTIQFSTASISVGEGDQNLSLTVTRAGDISGASTVSFASSDLAGSQGCSVVNGAASARCDYESSFSTLRFAAGETSKLVTILLVDDAYLEGPETFTLSLTNPSGAALGSNALATVSITDNEIAQGANPIDVAGFYVRQHYFDFFTREPDSGGLAFWTNEITSCLTDSQCIEVKRINVSAAFYLSIEFQQTGYLVERIYKSAYGDAPGVSTLGGAHQLPVPIVRMDEFLADTQQIGSGVVVSQPGWEQVLEKNKVAFTTDFVQRSRFTTALPLTLTPAQFVDALNANAGSPLSQAERDQLVNELTAGSKTRAQVLRAVAEDPDLSSAEFNRAFVLMQYFGYLRRNPNDAPDFDYTGYDFWLTKLNQFGGNFVNAEMVKAFITSGEYRERFGP